MSTIQQEDSFSLILGLPPAILRGRQPALPSMVRYGMPKPFEAIFLLYSEFTLALYKEDLDGEDVIDHQA
jgi:hypothetical protein